MDHPLLIATTSVFGLWVLVGLVLSVRRAFREAEDEGRSRVAAGVVGVLLAFPPEALLTGLALLAVWRAA